MLTKEVFSLNNENGTSSKTMRFLSNQTTQNKQRGAAFQILLVLFLMGKQLQPNNRSLANKGHTQLMPGIEMPLPQSPNRGAMNQNVIQLLFSLSTQRTYVGQLEASLFNMLRGKHFSPPDFSSVETHFRRHTTIPKHIHKG